MGAHVFPSVLPGPGPDVPREDIARLTGRAEALAKTLERGGAAYDAARPTNEIAERIAAKQPLLDANIRARAELIDQHHDIAAAKAVPTSTAVYKFSSAYRTAVLLYILVFTVDLGSLLYVPLTYIKASGLIASYSGNLWAALPLTTIFLALVPGLRTISGTLKKPRSRTLYRQALLIFGVAVVACVLVPAFSAPFNLSSIIETTREMGVDGPPASSMHAGVGFLLTMAHLLGSAAMAAGAWLGIDAIADVNKVHDYDRAADVLQIRIQHFTSLIDTLSKEIGADRSLLSAIRAGREVFLSKCEAFLASCESRLQARQLALRDRLVDEIVSELDGARSSAPLPRAPDSVRAQGGSSLIELAH